MRLAHRLDKLKNALQATCVDYKFDPNKPYSPSDWTEAELIRIIKQPTKELEEKYDKTNWGDPRTQKSVLAGMTVAEICQLVEDLLLNDHA